MRYRSGPWRSAFRSRGRQFLSSPDRRQQTATERNPKQPRWSEKKKLLAAINLLTPVFTGRDGGIRTRDPLHSMLAAQLLVLELIDSSFRSTTRALASQVDHRAVDHTPCRSRSSFPTPVASSNSSTYGQANSSRQDGFNYELLEASCAMRAAASLIR